MVGSLPTEQEVTSILANPKVPEHMYASGPAGVFQSNDAGVTWEPVGTVPDDASITGMALDTKEPARLFAVRSDGSLLASADGAASWETVNN